MSAIRKLVITGGVACGKSLVAERLEAWAEGRLVRFDADAAVHELYGRAETRRAIVERFGEEILDDGGGVDRSRLGERVFASVEKRRWLENLIHPQVAARRDEFVREVEADGDLRIRWIAAEIPLWFEAEVAWAADVVLAIGADPEVQAKRLRQHRNLGGEQIVALLGSQWPSSRKVALADLACWNDGTPTCIERQLKILVSILFEYE